MNDLNDDYELENPIENIKQTWIQDYKSCYDNKEDSFKNETALFNPVS